jgi:signal transduction histidine kinase
MCPMMEGASQKRPRIFEYFYRAEPNQTAGSGIGLAFCAQVIERLGHKIWIEDTTDGKSIAFCFTVSLVS